MARVAGIGKQDFEKVRVSNNFYVDKTHFIREWWEAEDDVTLITRPRRFGKTLNMSMLEKFFSVEYAGRGDLFEGLSIWEEEKYRRLQGTCPVIFLSFADIKETSFVQTRKAICRVIRMLYDKFAFLLEGDCLLLEGDIDTMNEAMNDISASLFSSFDTGNNPSGRPEPERFYHGFVLGLMVELSDRYVITSNRESGFGRYDVMMEPKDRGMDAYILEFKVARANRGETLEDTVQAALDQIGKRQYETALTARGIPAERIRKYGFAFCGKKVLIGA